MPIQEKSDVFSSYVQVRRAAARENKGNDISVGPNPAWLMLITLI